MQVPYSETEGQIGRILGPDNYIIKVVFQGKNSDYTLQLVNNTNQAEDIGVLQGVKNTKGFLNINNRRKYYQFNLTKRSMVSLSLDEVTSQVSMKLYVDTNGNGLIESNEYLADDISYSSRPGSIKRDLGADRYFIVIQKAKENTQYNLTMMSQ